MDNQNNDQKGPVKKAASKLPSKAIVFSNQPKVKGGPKSGKAGVDKSKKGGVNLMRKLSGM